MKTPFLFPVFLAATQFVLPSAPVAETDATVSELAAAREKFPVCFHAAKIGLKK